METNLQERFSILRWWKAGWEPPIIPPDSKTVFDTGAYAEPKQYYEMLPDGKLVNFFLGVPLDYRPFKPGVSRIVAPGSSYIYRARRLTFYDAVAKGQDPKTLRLSQLKKLRQLKMWLYVIVMEQEF